MVLRGARLPSKLGVAAVSYVDEGEGRAFRESVFPLSLSLYLASLSHPSEIT